MVTRYTVDTENTLWYTFTMTKTTLVTLVVILILILGCALPNQALEVKVERTLLDVPTIDDPARQVYMIEYQVWGELPHFIFIPQEEWTNEREAELIREDILERGAAEPEEEIIFIR
ncbi:hypothetical protein ES708_34658 [subsurface metagenome]